MVESGRWMVGDMPLACKHALGTGFQCDLFRPSFNGECSAINARGEGGGSVIRVTRCHCKITVSPRSKRDWHCHTLVQNRLTPKSASAGTRPRDSAFSRWMKSWSSAAAIASTSQRGVCPGQRNCGARRSHSWAHLRRIARIMEFRMTPLTRPRAMRIGICKRQSVFQSAGGRAIWQHLPEAAFSGMVSLQVQDAEDVIDVADIRRIMTFP